MNNINFDSFDDILHNSVFAIPDYQRDYAWNNGEVGTLIEDIFNLYEHNGDSGTDKHFCGSVVAIEYDEDVSRNTRSIMRSQKIRNFDKLNIIDGQQRISTLSLFLLALRDYADSNNLVIESVNGLLDTGRRDDSGLPIPIFNFQNSNTQNCYLQLLYKDEDDKSTKWSCDARRSGAKKLRQAYRQCLLAIEQQCQASTDAAALINALHEQVAYNLTFVGINCDDDADAYQIFESLNATGLSLTPAEQVKNLILMNSADSNADVTLQRWEDITSSVGEDHLVSFLSHYLFYDLGHRVLRKDVYAEYKEYLRRQSASTLLTSLKNAAEVYRDLRNPVADSQSSESLLDMQDLAQEQAYVPLMTAGIRFGVSSKEFAAIADAILVYIVRHMVCGQSSNKLDSVFGDACTFIKVEANSDKAIVDFFKEKQLPDDDFESFFKNLTFDYTAKPQKVAQTLLRRIEEHLHGGRGRLSLSRNQLTVEHIIPKQPAKAELSKWLGDSAVNSASFDLVDFTNQTIKSIGNLALLYQPENSSAGNNSYPEKIAFYTTDFIDKNKVNHGKPAETFKLIEALLKDYPNNFDEESVEERAQSLAAIAKVAWS